jgi:hypothetical protein
MLKGVNRWEELYVENGYFFKKENRQLLGFGKGVNVFEAFKYFKDNHIYLKEYAFHDVIAIECVGETIRHLEL